MKFDEKTGTYIPNNYEREALGYGDLEQPIPYDKMTLLHAITASRNEILDVDVENIKKADRIEFIATRHGWLGRLEDMERRLNGEELNSGIAEAAQHYINSFND